MDGQDGMALTVNRIVCIIRNRGLYQGKETANNSAARSGSGTGGMRWKKKY